MAVPEHHIREAVARYVAGEVNRQELQEWFAPIAWELLAGGPSSAADLAAEMELIFAESTSEGWPDSVLRERLVDAAALPPGRLFHVDSTLSASVTGGPLQNTVFAHQSTFSTFWVDITNPGKVERAA
jgi:hypothetical protein